MSEKKFKILRIFFLVLIFIQIFYIYEYRSGFNFEIIKNPFSKNSGIEFSVPPQAIESKRIIVKNQLDSFNLSDGIKSNEALYQRIIEFNYPIRFKNNTNIYFFLKQEKSPENCSILEDGEYLYLSKC